MSVPTFTEGYIDFTVDGETFKTWYRQYHVNSPNPTVRPLVLVHGGPGVAHYYLVCFEDLVLNYGIPIVLYDQLGCGKSTHLREKPESFWSVDLFVKELDNVLLKLELGSEFDLFGHSWGGILALEYIYKHQPARLRRLILTDALASMDVSDICSRQLIRNLPTAAQDAIYTHEQSGTTESQEYKDAVALYYSKHLCRLKPMPGPVLQSFGAISEDPTVYVTMGGPSEFYITGHLKGWSIVDRIQDIRVETLLTNGHFDETPDACMQPFFDTFDKVKWVRFAESSHMPFWEERQLYMKTAGNFLCR